MMTSFCDDLMIRPKQDEMPFDDVEIPADATSQNVICVFNLPQETKDDQLQSFFGAFGKIDKIYTIRDKYKGEGVPPTECKCKGYAFIYYAEMESAHRARDEANNAEFKGRTIRVDISLTAKKERVEAPLSDVLGVFGLPGDVAPEEVKAAFLERGTDASRVNLVREKPSGRCKGFGFVYFPSVPSAKAAKEACHDLVIKGHMVRVDYSLTREPREAEQKAKSPPATSFPRGARPCNVLGCFGLPATTIEQDVKALFNNYGQVFKVDIVMDKATGRCKGYGFVYFTKTEDATKAFEAFTSGELTPSVKGQNIRIDYSLTTAPPQTRSNADGGLGDEEKPSRGSGGGGGGGNTGGMGGGGGGGKRGGMRRESGGKSDSGDSPQYGGQQVLQFPSGAGGGAGGGVPHQFSGMQQMAQQHSASHQPGVLKLEGVPEDLLACFPLPPQQELDKAVGYARGYDDCRVSMLSTMDGLIKAGRLMWNPMQMGAGINGMTSMQPGLGAMNIQGLNGMGRQGMMLGQQPDINQQVQHMHQQDLAGAARLAPAGGQNSQSGNAGFIAPQTLQHFYLPSQSLLPSL
eukprot:TRINITY_DN6475_c0_g4_i2.p1 TRINITY_DN6475_c0_g4~~TRINITY_DN6475_c0_g4_i2.p1  ORF type:complete len:622 (+),score=183.31 TRINITY_DN6475_c0_g4_i2:143-1867(+)